MTITAALLIELAWKSLLVSGATLGLLRLARERSPAERSWIAHIGLVALLLLGPVALFAPDWNPLPLPAESSPLVEAVVPPSTREPIALSALHRRAAVLVEAPWLAALARAQKRMGFKHGTALLISDELRSPVSWGVIRPIILLNPGAVEASREAEAIIAHELAHVAHIDWAKLLVARIAGESFWPFK